MKLYAECIACQVQVRYRDVERLVVDENKRLEAMRGVLNIIADALNACRGENENCTPTAIATKLFRYIKSFTGLKDPYRELKMSANISALKLYNRLREKVYRVQDPKERLSTALKISLIGNALDIGVASYIPPDINDVIKFVESMDVYGDVEDCIDILMKSRLVVLVMDNSGEAVLDRVLADVLRPMGKRVVAVVKGGAFQNDITVDDVDQAMLAESFDEILSTGTDASSIHLDEIDRDTLAKIRTADVIVSKGMANYEYITEVEHVLGRPVVYMLIAKCPPIARDLGVQVGKAVIRVVRKP